MPQEHGVWGLGRLPWISEGPQSCGSRGPRLKPLPPSQMCQLLSCMSC